MRPGVPEGDTLTDEDDTMSEKVYSLAQDLKEAQAMADALAGYVRQDQLYGSVGGGFFSSGRMPALTAGALLMRLRRLHVLADQLTPPQRELLDRIETTHQATADAWRVHYDGKLLREANSRLDAMRTFFEECAQSPGGCPRIYLPEVLRRTIVEELLIAIKARGLSAEDVQKKARMTDGRLRSFVRAADFIWAEALQPAYPEKQFWWMYSAPPGNDR